MLVKERLSMEANRCDHSHPQSPSAVNSDSPASVLVLHCPGPPGKNIVTLFCSTDFV